MTGEEKRGTGDDRLLAAGQENTDRAGVGGGLSAVHTAAAAALFAVAEVGCRRGDAAYSRAKRALLRGSFYRLVLKRKESAADGGD